MNNIVTVYVNGEKFSLVCDGTDERTVKEIADKVETKIRSISASNPLLKKEKCLLLACLDYCDDERKSMKKLDEMRTQIKEYLDDSDKKNRELIKLKAENSDLKQRIKELSGEEIPQEETEEAPKEAIEAPHKTVVAVGKIDETKKNNIKSGAVQQSLF